MLDECKGEKLLELLLVFSTVILKKTSVGRADKVQRCSASYELSTASALHLQKQELILPFVISYESYLKSVLESREREKLEYQEIAATFKLKEKEISERQEYCEKALQTAKRATSLHSDNGSLAIRNHLISNWHASSDWLEIIRSGGNSTPAGHFLPDNVLTFLESSESELSSTHQNLLHDLESRVAMQKVRLNQWKKFHSRIQAENPSRKNASTKGLETNRSFQLQRHKHLQIGDKGIGAAQSEQIRNFVSPGQKYTTLVSKMRIDLLESSTVQSKMPKSFLERSFLTGKPIMPVTNDSTLQLRPEKCFRKIERHGDTTMKQTARQSKSAEENTLTAPEKPQDQLTRTSQTQTMVDDDREGLTRQPSVPSQPRALPHNVTSPILMQPIPSSPPLAASPDIVKEILTSINLATPSPTKKFQPRLTLTERTRLSMATPGVNMLPSPEESPLDHSLLPSQPKFAANDPNRRATLLERTRQSMSLIPPRPTASDDEETASNLAETKKHRAARKSRQSRASNFPVNQFETPPPKQRTKRLSAAAASHKASGGTTRHSFMDGIDELDIGGTGGVATGESTPKEQLFSDDAEYASVFKSRPRVAISPVPESEGHSLPPDGFDVDEEDEESEGEDDGRLGPEQQWASSPLADIGARTR